MPFCQDFFPCNKEEKLTTPNRPAVENLIVLRKALDNDLKRTLSRMLLLATWNILDFDKSILGSRLTELAHHFYGL